MGADAVVDSTRALLLWEPRRIVPAYAVPEGDITAELVPTQAGDGQRAGMDSLAPGASGGSFRVLSPGHFRTHTTEGRS